MSQSVWECKIGADLKMLPSGADAPMRDAIKKAFLKITGQQCEFIFSGWGAELTDAEKQYLEAVKRAKDK